MFNLVIYQPEIPPNTGNIIRLCANTGSKLHLIKPFGFELEDKRLLRAGLDYHEFASVCVYENYEDFITYLANLENSPSLYALSTKGQRIYTDVKFQKGDFFLLGPESRGLPPEILNSMGNDKVIKLPQLPHSRSLNLSNTAAIIVYYAWSLHGFL